MTSSAEYWAKVASNRTLRERRWITPDELIRPLAALDVASHADLIRALPGLDKPALIAAIRVFDILRVRRAGPALFGCWLSPDRDVSFAAGQALQSVGSRRAYRRLIDYIWSKPTPSGAEQACYILSFSYDDTLVDPLLEIYKANNIPFEVRAQAAEGIANHLGHVDRRTKEYHQALPLLINGLLDPTPEVRFWTCFALGSMRATHALPELERVAADDDAVCPTWWLVKEEAADAICHIHGGHAPDRVRLGGCGSTPSLS